MRPRINEIVDQTIQHFSSILFPSLPSDCSYVARPDLVLKPRCHAAWKHAGTLQCRGKDQLYNMRQCVSRAIDQTTLYCSSLVEVDWSENITWEIACSTRLDHWHQNVPPGAHDPCLFCLGQPCCHQPDSAACACWHNLTQLQTLQVGGFKLL